MAPDRRLIVNADDFGRSPGINDGVAEAHETGIVTSASLMVRWPAAAEAARYARTRPALGVGLHVDVGEWTWRDGGWQRRYAVVDVSSRPAVAGEVARQLARFRDLVGHNPTHLDSHQQAHRREPLRSVLRDVADALDVPLRHETPEVQHRPDFYGQTRTGRAVPDAIAPGRLVEWMSALGPDTVELRCHPAARADLESDYASLRCDETRTLCDTRVREAVAKLRIELCDYRAVPIAPPAGRHALACGDVERAVEIFRDDAERNSSHVWPWVWLARAARAAGDYTGSLRALLRAVAVEPRSTVATECAMELLGTEDAAAGRAFSAAMASLSGSGVEPLRSIKVTLASLHSPAASRARAVIDRGKPVSGTSQDLSAANVTGAFRVDAARCLALGDPLAAWRRLQGAPLLDAGGHLMATTAAALQAHGHLHESLRAFALAAQCAPDDADLHTASQAVSGELQVLTGRWSAPPLPASALRPCPERVLHVVGPSLPGVQSGYTVRTQSVARAQRAAGIEAHVVTELGFAGGAAVDDIPYHRLAPGGEVPVRLDARLAANARALHALVRELCPSVLHAASDYRNALLALAVGRACRIPVVYEMRGFWEDTWRAGLGASALPGERYALLQSRELACAQAADHVCTLSDAMRRDLVARGLAADRVAVIPNGVDVDLFSPRPRDAALAAQLGIAPQEIVVGYVSTLNAYEGVDGLLRALALLVRQGLAVRGLIVGDGPDHDRLLGLAADLGIAGRVHFAGRVPHAQVLRYYALLDVFVVPRTDQRVSRLVPPLKPLEAMAMEKAVVVSGVGALGELVTHDVTGCVYPPGDVDALRSVLALLAGQAPLRRRLGAAARQFVVSSRTWSAIGRRYRALYQRLVPETALAKGASS